MFATGYVAQIFLVGINADVNASNAKRLPMKTASRRLRSMANALLAVDESLQLARTLALHPATELSRASLALLLARSDACIVLAPKPAPSHAPPVLSPALSHVAGPVLIERNAICPVQFLAKPSHALFGARIGYSADTSVPASVERSAQIPSVAEFVLHKRSWKRRWTFTHSRVTEKLIWM